MNDSIDMPDVFCSLFCITRSWSFNSLGTYRMNRNEFLPSGGTCSQESHSLLPSVTPRRKGCMTCPSQVTLTYSPPWCQCKQNLVTNTTQTTQYNLNSGSLSKYCTSIALFTTMPQKGLFGARYRMYRFLWICEHRQLPGKSASKLTLTDRVNDVLQD